jgi:hypothetical protein
MNDLRHTEGKHLKSRVRPDDANAFFDDPFVRNARRAGVHTRDALAEALAEQFLATATSGEGVAEDVRDEVTTEELGGPFLERRVILDVRVVKIRRLRY